MVYKSVSEKQLLSKSLLQILVSFLVIGEHPNQQELAVEKINLQLESEEWTQRPLRAYLLMKITHFLMSCWWWNIL